MSRLEELINELCPSGVPFFFLEEKADIHRGVRVVKNQLDSKGEYPVFQNALQPMGRYHAFNEKGGKTYVISAGAAGEIGFSSQDFWAADDCLVIIGDESLNDKYVYYWLMSRKSFIGSMVRKASIPRLSRKIIEKLRIPVPPMEVQCEIVRILDNFTELTAELTAELTVRKKQYEYYRDWLFLNAKNSIIRNIGSFAKLCAGATPSTSKSEYWENGNIPWMSSGEVNLGEVFDTEKRITQAGYDNSSTKMLPVNTVVIALAGQGKTRGTVAITRIELCTNQSLCGVITDKTVNPEYLRYYLQTQYMKLRDVSAGDGTRGGLNLKMISSFEVPVPPINEQNKIVDALKVLDSYSTSLSFGLPAEIEARQRQYEYYRDKLLTFKEAE